MNYERAILDNAAARPDGTGLTERNGLNNAKLDTMKQLYLGHESSEQSVKLPGVTLVHDSADARLQSVEPNLSKRVGHPSEHTYDSKASEGKNDSNKVGAGADSVHGAESVDALKSNLKKGDTKTDSGKKVDENDYLDAVVKHMRAPNGQPLSKEAQAAAFQWLKCKLDNTPLEPGSLERYEEIARKGGVDMNQMARALKSAALLRARGELD